MPLNMHSSTEPRPSVPRKYSSDAMYKAQIRRKRLQPRDDGEQHRLRSRAAVRLADDLAVMSDDEKVYSTHRSNGAPNGASRPSVAPMPRIEIQEASTRGEPVVQDFADRYIPKQFQPERSGTNRAESPPVAHISSLQMSSDDDVAPAPPDLSRRGMHVPSRTSSATSPQKTRRRASGSSVPTTPEAREKSSYAESFSSYGTSASSVPTGELPALQTKPLDDVDRLSPLAEDDPMSFDLVAQPIDDGRNYSLEKRSEQMFSREHLEEIFAEPTLMLRFTSYLSKCRPKAIPLLIYYLDSLKALRAISYANAVAEALEPISGHDFTEHPARQSVNSVLEDKAKKAFDALVQDELPSYITHIFIQYVSVSVQRRICGTLPPHLREASEGLAEVFCLTDPSRPDNPIVFASEEFHRTTQYGVNYAIGRNCRFLQGPRTNPHSHIRMRKAIDEEREHSEVFLNYRRDGSPFMNLLMIAPLFDSRGKLRYFIGAQVDVSGLVKECTDLEALQRLLEKEDMEAAGHKVDKEDKKDEFQDLSEMLNATELEIVRRHGGKMHREYTDDEPEDSRLHQPRLLLKEPSPDINKADTRFNLGKTGGKLEGVYQNYLLVRPYPSLRILFASPALRVPGMLQSPFLSRIGGSSRVRDELTAALAAGRGVTAKIRWMPSPVGSRYSTESNSSYSSDEGRARWIHCTPLLGHNGAVGVWMVVLIDEEGSQNRRPFKMAPPVSHQIMSSEKQRLGRSFIGEPEGPQRPPTAPNNRSNDRLMSPASTPSRPASRSSQVASRHQGPQGAFADWERRRDEGDDRDGSGSMNSFALM